MIHADSEMKIQSTFTLFQLTFLRFSISSWYAAKSSLALVTARFNSRAKSSALLVAAVSVRSCCLLVFAVVTVTLLISMFRGIAPL